MKKEKNEKINKDEEAITCFCVQKVESMVERRIQHFFHSSFTRPEFSTTLVSGLRLLKSKK